MMLKRLLRPAMALLLVAAFLLCAACSTPKVAMTVGGKYYEMGDYLAYLYQTISSDYTIMMYQYYYGEQMGVDLLDSTELGLTYGDSTQAITLRDYIHKTTQDTIFYQRALELMMKEEEINHAIDVYVDLKHEIISQIESLPEDEYDVLYDYYVLDFGLFDIASSRGQSVDWIKKLKWRGISKITVIESDVYKEACELLFSKKSSHL